jgi:MoxR-like ATPase
MRARVVNGRWVLDDPADLPEGTVVEIITRPVNPPGEIYFDERLRAYLRAICAAARPARPDIERELVDRARAAASRANRTFVTPVDVVAAAHEVLGRSPELEAIIANTPVP